MTTSKIDRNAVVQQLQRMGAPETAPLEKLEEVAQVQPAPAEVATQFGARPAYLDQKSGEGKAVSISATASALWGKTGLDNPKPPLAAMALKNNLTIEQAKLKYAEKEKQQAE